MSQGLANAMTLYDKDGNPVQVIVRDGDYRLTTLDSETHDSLDEIKLLLIDVIEALPDAPDYVDTDSIDFDLSTPNQIKANVVPDVAQAILVTQIFGS